LRLRAPLFGYASRQTGIVGEAGLQAGRVLKQNIIDVEAVILNLPRDQLDIEDGVVVRKGSNFRDGLPLKEPARIVYYRGNELPIDCLPNPMATHQYRVKEYAFVFANGTQGCLLKVDPNTGFIKLLKLWCVDDSGRVINPKLLDEQIRGGMVQGIGAALFEHCIYDERRQLLNATMADYLLPMATETPDIETAHVETLTSTSALGAKGVGESGTSGAPAVILNAVNDALQPFNAKVTSQPTTPDSVQHALGTITYGDLAYVTNSRCATSERRGCLTIVPTRPRAALLLSAARSVGSLLRTC
jgi:carbon-monoxide dehydrogenase large subunit